MRSGGSIVGQRVRESEATTMTMFSRKKIDREMSAETSTEMIACATLDGTDHAVGAPDRATDTIETTTTAETPDIAMIGNADVAAVATDTMMDGEIDTDDSAGSLAS